MPTNENPQQKQRSVCITQSKIEKYNVNKDQPFENQLHEDRQQSEVEPMDVCEDYEKNEDKSKGTGLDPHPNRNEEGSIFLGKAGSDTSELTELKTRVVVEGTSSVSDEKKGMGNTSREEKPFAVTATGPATYPPSKQSATYQSRNKCVGDSRVPEKERCLQLEGSDPQGNLHSTTADRRHTDPITTRTVIYPPGVASPKYQKNESVMSSGFAEEDKALQLAGFAPRGSSCATAIGAPEKVFANPTAAGPAGHLPYVLSAMYQGNKNMALSRSSEQDRTPQRAGLDHPEHSPSTIVGTPGQLYTNPTATGAKVYQHSMPSTQYKDERMVTWSSAEQVRGSQLVGGVDPLGVTPSTAVEAPQQLYTKPTQWYSSARGQEDLKIVQQSLSVIADGGNVEMERSSTTHDLAMKFVHHGTKWIIEFSYNFPYSGTKVKQERRNHWTGKCCNEMVKSIGVHSNFNEVLRELEGVIKRDCSKCKTVAAKIQWSRHIK